jgi:uncharacterized protein YyaL (SSP411 family)
VDWYPWGPEALTRAATEDRPILLSIGYSACHWCHVMAHESFEDPETAALMNRLFVNIKVDREERPDVDAIYMEATVAMTGQGGWPMTVFMTPGGEPFYCGTYFPNQARGGMPSFRQICEAIDDAWKNRRDDITEQAGQLAEHLRREPRLGADSEVPGPDALDRAEIALLSVHDDEWGGFGGAPKFPGSMSIDLLLRQYRRTGSEPALAAATRSLDAMAAGGIWDHLGGGFSRYSTDSRWLVPHFEKMLYDNALLIRPYLHSWQLTGNAEHLEVLTATIAYTLADLRHPTGGFYSAEDADSEGVEGKFYVWTRAELDSVLGADAEVFAEWYGVTERGNFEGANILHRPVGDFARPAEIDELRARLLEARSSRVRPGLDDKVLTEWNALMLASLAEAAAATGREDWARAAVMTAGFLCGELRRDDGRWRRAWQEGTGARHRAYAHDYAALIDAFTRVYELTGQARWLAEATSTADGLVELFWDADGASLWTTGSDAEALLTRPRDLQDNATPSAQSVAALALLRLAPLVDRPDLTDIARQILALLGPVASQHPQAFGNLLLAVEPAAGLDEVVVCGDRPDLVEAVRARWHPTSVLSWGDRLEGPLWEGREDGRAYVCRHYTCGLPATTPEGLEGQLA